MQRLKESNINLYKRTYDKKNNLFCLSFPLASVVADLPTVATVTSTVTVSPVTVVTVSTVPSPVTAVQTLPLLPAALPHSVAQPTTAIPAFPPVMVPPFRVPLPGMHIPLPGEKTQTQSEKPLVLHGCTHQHHIHQYALHSIRLVSKTVFIFVWLLVMYTTVLYKQSCTIQRVCVVCVCLSVTTNTPRQATASCPPVFNPMPACPLFFQV